MAKKRVTRRSSNKRSSTKRQNLRSANSQRVYRTNSNSSQLGVFDRINLEISSDKNYSYLGLLLGFVLLVAFMNEGSYTGNQITGSAIEDITGAQTRSGITPITNMLKDLIGAIFGPDGIIAIIFLNLTTGASWLPAVAVVMIISVMFYIVLRKSVLPGDQHKKAIFLLSLGLGLLSIGVTVDGLTLVDMFKELISGTVGLVVVLVLGFAFWIFALWGIRKTSKAWGKMHETSSERIGLRRNQLGQRADKWREKTDRAELVTLNKLVNKYSMQYRNATSPMFKAKAEKEFRAKAAKSCPNLNPQEILKAWNAAII